MGNPRRRKLRRETQTAGTGVPEVVVVDKTATKPKPQEKVKKPSLLDKLKKK